MVQQRHLRNLIGESLGMIRSQTSRCSSMPRCPSIEAIVLHMQLWWSCPGRMPEADILTENCKQGSDVVATHSYTPSLADSQAYRETHLPAGVVGSGSRTGAYEGRDVRDEKAHLLRTPLFLCVSSFVVSAPIKLGSILLQRRHDITHRLQKFLEKFSSCLI